jgi:hypothetical protein
MFSPPMIERFFFADFIEHPGVPLSWSVNTTLTDDEIDKNTNGLFDQELQQWQNSKTGRLTQTSLTHIMYGRIPSNHSIFQTVADPSGGPNAPHFELIVAVRYIFCSISLLDIVR